MCKGNSLFNSVIFNVTSARQVLDGVHLSIGVVLRLGHGSTDEQCHNENGDSEHLEKITTVGMV